MGKVTRPFCWHQNFVNKGLSAPAPGLYTCGKTKKMCIKSEFKEICLKLATNSRSDKGFLLTSKVCPQEVFFPCPGAIYMYKIIKNVYKIRFRRDHFETSNIWAKKKDLSVVINFWSPVGCLLLPWAIYMWKKHIKIGKKIYFKEIFFKLATNGWSDKEFPLHQNFVPKGMSVPALGLYTCIKSFKMCLKSFFKEIVLKLATNGQNDKGFLFVPHGVVCGSAPALGLYTCIKALKYTPGPGVRWGFTGPLVPWFMFKNTIIMVFTENFFFHFWTELLTSIFQDFPVGNF